MENTPRGEQSSKKNSLGRKRPRSPTDQNSPPTGSTGQVTPAGTAALTSGIEPTRSTGRNTLTVCPAPTTRAVPAPRAAPTACTSHPAPKSCAALTAPPTVHVAPSHSIKPTRPTGRCTSTGCSTATIRVAPTSHDASAGRGAPSSQGASAGRHTNAGRAPSSRIRAPTEPNGSNHISAPAGPNGRAPSSRIRAPTGPNGRVTSAPSISTGRRVPNNSATPTGPAIRIRPTISSSSALPGGHSSSTSLVPSITTGPTYKPLLKLQADHRAQLVMKGEFLNPMFTREHIRLLPWNARYENYIIEAGLYGIHKIGHIPTDHALISALVERWREETHSFHFPVGEMTITLQDAAVLLGLRVDGDPICLRTNRNWEAVVRSLLGREVDDTTFRQRSRVAINLSWLHRHFSQLDPQASDQTVEQYARAYCLVLVGSLLFTDHSGDSISAIYLPLFANFKKAGEYSWASGVLAYLYKELCLATKPTRKQFGGSVMLLQLWSWERLPMGRPTIRRNEVPHLLGGMDLARRPPLGYVWSTYHQFADYVTCRVTESYRREIDGLTDADVIWLPYEGKMDVLPANCRPEDRKLWRTIAPLIHFWIVEMYNPDRVARQFDRYQQVPPPLRDTNHSLHELQNGVGRNWPSVHARYLQRWHHRGKYCLRDRRPYEHSMYKEYMRWFSTASILYLSSPGGVPNTRSSVEAINNIATSIVERFRYSADEDSRVFFRKMLHSCRYALMDILEPISNDDIFSALDDQQPQQQESRAVAGDKPEPSNRAPP